MSKKLFFVGVLAVLLWPNRANADSIALVPGTGSTFNSIVNHTVGWSFAVDVPVYVTALGYYDHQGDGLLHDYPVALWSAGGDLLATTDIASGTAASLVDGFRFNAVSPLLLLPGEYVLGAVANTGVGFGGDRVLDLVSTLTTDDAITFITNIGANVESASLIFPTESYASQGNGFFGPNMMLSADPGGDVAPIPEPSSFSLVLGTLIAIIARKRQSV